MTAEEILMGRDCDDYPGLIPLVRAYLEFIKADPESVTKVCPLPPALLRCSFLLFIAYHACPD
jgi:hypothetical protein